MASTPSDRAPGGYLPFIRRHPFLLLGLLTLALFFAVEGLDRAGHVHAVAVAGPALRVLIIPMYAVWLPFTMLNAALAASVGQSAAVAWLAWICSLVAGLVPYVLADRLLARWQRLRSHRDPAT